MGDCPPSTPPGRKRCDGLWEASERLRCSQEGGLRRIPRKRTRCAQEAQDQEAKGWGCGRGLTAWGQRPAGSSEQGFPGLFCFSYIFSYLLFPWE